MSETKSSAISPSAGFKRGILKLLHHLGYQLIRREPNSPFLDVAKIPDASCYKPFFSPWLCDTDFKRLYSKVAEATLVSQESCYTLWTLARQTVHLEGLFLECGVYKGGTARFLADILEMSPQPRDLHLFDTFKGMPRTSDFDLHKEGHFGDASLASVKEFIGARQKVFYHVGVIPEVFRELPDCPIAFAHIDVDIHDAILESCRQLYSRLLPGGIMVFDDYGFASCPGARRAIDDFFLDKPEMPLVLQTSQAVIIKQARTLGNKFLG